jgi:hypothetical protein
MPLAPPTCGPFPFPPLSAALTQYSFLLSCLPCSLSLALGQHRIVSHGGCLLQSFLCIFYQSFTFADLFFSTLSYVSSARSPVHSLFLSNSLNFRRHYFPFLSSTYDPTKMPVGPAHVYKLAFSLPRDHDKIYFLCYSKFPCVRPSVDRILFVFVIATRIGLDFFFQPPFALYRISLPSSTFWFSAMSSTVGLTPAPGKNGGGVIIAVDGSGFGGMEMETSQ